MHGVVRKQKKDIGWRAWDNMRDERRDNAALTHNRRDAVVVVQRGEGRRMPVGRGDHEERGNPRTIAVVLKAFATANS
jgi:hypothetical protein